MPRSSARPSTQPWRTILQFCVTDGVPRRSLLVALIVGVILNVINQGDVLITGGDVDMLKVALTFIVPYCVATYGAVSVQVATLKAETYASFPVTGGSPHDRADAARPEDRQQPDDPSDDR